MVWTWGCTGRCSPRPTPSFRIIFPMVEVKQPKPGQELCEKFGLDLGLQRSLQPTSKPSTSHNFPQGPVETPEKLCKMFGLDRWLSPIEARPSSSHIFLRANLGTRIAAECGGWVCAGCRGSPFCFFALSKSPLPPVNIGCAVCDRHGSPSLVGCQKIVVTEHVTSCLTTLLRLHSSIAD